MKNAQAVKDNFENADQFEIEMLLQTTPNQKKEEPKDLPF